MKMKKTLLFTLMAAICAANTLPFFVSGAENSLLKYGMLPVYGNDINNGTYSIDILCDSEDFPVSETTLTVSDGIMTAELSFTDTNYEMLYPGTAADAMTDSNEDAILSIQESEDNYTCTFPVEALDKELPCAVFLAEEESWVDLTLVFDATSLPTDALLIELPDYDRIEAALAAFSDTEEDDETAQTDETTALEPVEAMNIDKKDGEYSIGVDLTGGSGKAYVSSPALLTVRDGKAYVRLEWSSSYYDYMIVGTEKYLPINTEGNSIFEIPIAVMDEDMPVIADTLAMGTPHEISYVLTFYSDSIGSKGQMPQEAAKRVLIVALIIIVGGGILNNFLKKKQAA